MVKTHGHNHAAAPGILKVANPARIKLTAGFKAQIKHGEEARRYPKGTWVAEVRDAIKTLKKEKFLLGDIYKLEEQFKKAHPENNNVRPKIRQSLQILITKGFLSRVNDGVYQILNA